MRSCNTYCQVDFHQCIHLTQHTPHTVTHFHTLLYPYIHTNLLHIYIHPHAPSSLSPPLSQPHPHTPSSHPQSLTSTFPQSPFPHSHPSTNTPSSLNPLIPLPSHPSTSSPPISHIPTPTPPHPSTLNPPPSHPHPHAGFSCATKRYWHQQSLASPSGSTLLSPSPPP